MAIPVITVPSQSRRAAPTLNLLYGEYECVLASSLFSTSAVTSTIVIGETSDTSNDLRSVECIAVWDWSIPYLTPSLFRFCDLFQLCVSGL